MLVIHYIITANSKLNFVYRIIMTQKETYQQATKNVYPQLSFFFIFIAVVLIVLTVFLSKKKTRQAQKNIKLAIGEWAPYTGEELDNYGVASGIVSHIFEEMGYETEFLFMPWPLAEKMAESGEENDGIRGTFPYRENAKRNKKFYFSETILTIEHAIFYNSDMNPMASQIRTIDDLKGYSILRIEGYEYPENIAMYINDSIQEMKDNMQAFLELEKSNKNLLVVEAKEVGLQLLEQKLPNLVSTIKMTPLTMRHQFKLMLSRRNPNNLSLKNEFNVKLNEFKSNKIAYLSYQNSINKTIEHERAVLLKAFENNVIRAYKGKNRNEVVLVPNGSMAIVKEWDNEFLDFQKIDDLSDSVLVKIKLLNGPLSLRDEFLYVDSRTIYLSE